MSLDSINEGSMVSKYPEYWSHIHHQTMGHMEITDSENHLLCPLENSDEFNKCTVMYTIIRMYSSHNDDLSYAERNYTFARIVWTHMVVFKNVWISKSPTSIIIINLVHFFRILSGETTIIQINSNRNPCDYHYWTNEGIHDPHATKTSSLDIRSKWICASPSPKALPKQSSNKFTRDWGRHSEIENDENIHLVRSTS